MMNEVYKKLDEAKDICIDKMDRTSDPEEFEKYSNQLVKITDAMTEIKKLEKDDKIDKKFLISTMVPVCAMIIGKIMEWIMLYNQTKLICNFETTNTFTSSAGKGLAGSLRIFPIFNNKGDR